MPSLPADAVNPWARVLLEAIAERLDLTTGQTILEAEFQDGQLRQIRRHEKVSASQLDRYDDERRT